MKWITKQNKLRNLYYELPKLTKRIRIKKKFLLFPLCLEGETRWLCLASVIQELSKRKLSTMNLYDDWKKVGYDGYHYYWEDKKWNG